MYECVFGLGVCCFVGVGCFADVGGHLTGSSDSEIDDGSTFEGSSGSEDGDDVESSDSGSVSDDEDVTDSSSTVDTEDIGTVTSSDTSGASGGAGTSSIDTSSASGSTGVAAPCPDGTAFTQGYCWAVALCDTVSCSVDGDGLCVTNSVTCEAYELESTSEDVFLEEWSEAVVQDLVDQLGLGGSTEPLASSLACGMWDRTLNKLRPWGYGSGVNYRNYLSCHPYDYWPIHTCIPNE